MWLLVGTITLASLLPGLGQRDLWSAAEVRPALVAWDMLETGRFLPPYLVGEPYLDKPPLFHGLVALSFHLTGRQDAWAARLPAVAAALAVVLLVFRLGADVAGPRAGLCSALFLLLSFRFFTLARASELEMLLTAAASLAYVAVLRSAARPENAKRWAAVLGVACGLGTFTKGPILALFFPALIVLALALRRRTVGPIKARVAVAGLVGVLLATAAYYGPLLSSSEAWEALTERAAMANVRHQRGLFYYLYQVPLGLLPAGLLLPAMLRRLGRQAEIDVLALTAGLGILALSLFPSKQTHYLLPLFPLFAVWGGVTFAQELERGRRSVLRLWAVLAFAGGLGLLAVPGLFRAFGQEELSELLARQPLPSEELAGVTLLGGVALVGLSRRMGVQPGDRAPVWAGWLAVAAALAFLSVLDGPGGRILGEERCAASAMRSFAPLTGNAPLALWRPDLEAIYHLGRRDLVFPGGPEEWRRFLADEPAGFLLVEGVDPDLLPEGVRSAPLRAFWRSPSGRHGFLLLGPGLH